MSEILLQPTPNWFTSRPIDICQKDGMIASSAICSIILTDNLFEKYNSTIKDAHSKRIVALSFYNCSNTTFNLLASCSEDLEIKVWNANTNSLVNNHTLHQNVPSCLDWLDFNDQKDQTYQKNDPILISCDIKGNVFKWNSNSNAHARYFPENKAITQLKCCPNKWLVALGYKQGSIVILDVKGDSMKIIHKLKIHEDKINCLCWFPINKINNESDTQKQLELLFETNDLSSILASSAEDETIRLLCTTKGDQLHLIKAPGTTNTSTRSYNNDKQKNKIKFTPLCWSNPSLIISGSFKGDLSYYDLLSDSKKDSIKWRNFSSLSSDKAHKKIIFDISSYNDQIVSFSLDRSINIWNMKTFKQETSMSTLNGYVYSIISSPIDPNVLAITVGDSSVKFLNEKQNKKITKSFTVPEVTQICWHPSKESMIAFGTKDGKVGIFDYMSNTKPAQFIYSGYNQSVYTLIWAIPLISDLTTEQSQTKSKYALYSVADGKINQHCIQFASSNSPNGPIVNQNIKTINLYSELNKQVENNSDDSTKSNVEYGLTEFQILNFEKTDEFHFMIGKFDGSIELYRKNINKITKLCTLFNHQKLITCIKWNKQHNPLSDIGLNLIASGSNDFNVVVIDFDALMTDLSNESSNLIFGKYKHKLIGHKERITSLSWSRHGSFNILASSSYDGTVQIWNAEEGVPIANYRGHSDKILSCLFSNNDPNIIYSGGEDYSLHKWKIDSQTFKIPPDECKYHYGKKKGKIAIKKVQKKSETNEQTNQQNEPNELEIELKENDSIFENEPAKPSSEIDMESKAVKKTIKSNSSQREFKSLLILSSHGNKSQKSKLKDCLDLFEMIYEKQSNIKDCLLRNKTNDLSVEFEMAKFDFLEDQINLFIFGNRFSTLRMIELEQAELKRLSIDKWWFLDIWLGNLAKIFQLFKDQSLLNDCVFNLYQISQSSNPNTLLFLNEYVNQLSQSGTTTNSDQIHKAVLYSLASFNVHKAIEIYCSKHMYQYALCIAHLRLSPDDKTFTDILTKYAIYATFTGDYETSVMCYIRLADFENASKVLIRRNVKNDIETENIIKKLLEYFTILMNKK